MDNTTEDKTLLEENTQEETIVEQIEMADEAAGGAIVDGSDNEDRKVDIVEHVQKQAAIDPVEQAKVNLGEDYETIRDTFTDILTAIEAAKIAEEVPADILDEVQSLLVAINDFNKNPEASIYTTLDAILSYLGTFLYTFGGVDSYVGIYTNKLDTLLFDIVGNTPEIEEMITAHLLRYDETVDTLTIYRSTFNGMVFTLGNIGNVISTLRLIIKTISVKEDLTTNEILENILSKTKL